MFHLAAVGLLVLSLAALSDEAFRDDFDTVDSWQAKPAWLGQPSEKPAVTSQGGVACFHVPEPERGMKWCRLIEPVETDLASWLVIRYRVEHYDPGRIDYLLWLDDADNTRDGVRLLAGDAILTDGQWHTQVLDLTQADVVSPITALALACFSTAAGEASLWVDYLAITDSPPADAEGYQQPLGPPQVWKVPITDATLWTVQPSWLANYGQQNSCEPTAEGTRFTVALPGRGAKWSRDLPEPITGATWVAMRYRASGLAKSNDYALYVGSDPGGKARQEQYLIRLGDLADDGAWHVQIARVTVPSVKTLAVQVQAVRQNASLEIGRLTFHDRRPPVSVAEVFAHEAGWPPEMAHFRPLSLPPGNVDGPGLARRLMLEGWLEGERITSCGVPFLLRQGTDAAIITPVREPGEIQVPLNGRAAETYLVLATALPASEEPSFGGGAMQSIRQVELFVARVEYGDGSSEEQFPLLIPAGRHVMTRGLATYALAVDPDRDLSRLVLLDRMARGSFALVAATLSQRPGPATAATTVRPARQLPPPRPVAARTTGITRQGSTIRAEAETLSLILDTSRGLRVVGAENHAWDGAPLQVAPGPLFRLETGDLKLTSEDFTVTAVTEEQTETGPVVRVDLAWERAQPPITVSVAVDVSTPQEVGLAARCDLGGRDRADCRFFFPELGGIAFGDDLHPDDVWYWMPCRGDVISNHPIALREPYAGGGNPFQIIGAFTPVEGTGLYLMTQDLEALPRYYLLQKTEGRVRLGVEWWPFDGTATRTVLGCTQGDWHAQLERYQRWLKSWYQPAAPRKDWFRRVFNFRQQFLHFELPVKSGMFDPETKTLRLREVLEQDITAFGGVDYLHLFDWGWDPVHGRCGDYLPWDYLGGAEHFAQAVQEIKDMGVPVGLYIEGYLVDPQSNLGKAHGVDWQLLDAQGNPYPYFAPSYNICSWVRDWQNHLAATYARAKRETGAVGFYIDQYGFSSPNHLCYNRAHGHPVPVTPVLGEREMTRRVREAVGPECAVYTEESPTDVNSQYQDGSFTYSITTTVEDWCPSFVNLYRFVLPTFKTIEIICCDQPLGSNIEACKRILFNGEAIWIEGIWDRWFTPQTRAYIALMHRVLRDNADCFASDCPQPLVPTLVEGLYANCFPQRADGRGKTCWTLYNTGFRTLRGELIRVAHQPGAVYRDEMNGKEVAARVDGNTAVLSLEVGPRDVVVVSRIVNSQ